MERSRELENRLIDFAVRIINVIEALPNTKVGNHIGGQLLRSPVPRRHPTMAKLKARNLEKTSSTK